MSGAENAITSHWRQRCICGEPHRANAHKSDGTPIAVWSCPQHGNVCEELAGGHTLTDFQRDVLKVISERHLAADDAGIDEVSWHLNRTTGSVARAVAFLRDAGLIEGA